jgi:phosphatidylglycerol:prolipoprotein diacylglycerol transferase
VAGLVGGRAGYIWANWSYFQTHGEEIGLVWEGGLSYHGALLAGLVVFLLWSAWTRVPAAGYAGLIAPGLALSSAIGWLACYFEGCAYGREAGFGLLSGDLPDSFGVYGLRYQTQLLGVVLCFLTLFIILALRGRLAPDRLFWLTLLLLSAGRLIVSLFRGDDIVMVGRLRLDTILEASLIGFTLLALAVTMFRRPPSPGIKTSRRQPVE